MGKSIPVSVCRALLLCLNKLYDQLAHCAQITCHAGSGLCAGHVQLLLLRLQAAGLTVLLLRRSCYVSCFQARVCHYAALLGLLSIDLVCSLLRAGNCVLVRLLLETKCMRRHERPP